MQSQSIWRCFFEEFSLIVQYISVVCMMYYMALLRFCFGYISSEISVYLVLSMKEIDLHMGLNDATKIYVSRESQSVSFFAQSKLLLKFSSITPCMPQCCCVVFCLYTQSRSLFMISAWPSGFFISVLIAQVAQLMLFRWAGQLGQSGKQ